MNTENKFLCSQCNITFTKKQSLGRHQKNIHAQDIKIAGNQVCTVCNEKCRTIVDLHNHIQKKHAEIELQFHEKMFYCQSDFDQWKAEFERESVSSYVIYAITKRKNLVTRHYRCHRSGYRALKKDSQRKILESIKTGFTCPSVMKTTKQTLDDGVEILVEYQSTHLGHECEVDKLHLQKEERGILAGMLKAGIPNSIIIEKIKEQYSPTKRLHHITKRDLNNICHEFNIPVQKEIETTINLCSVCNEKCRTILDLHSHIQMEHTDVKLEFQEIMFYCQSDFDQWKAEIESNGTSSFPLHHMTTYKDSVVKQYRCHRSGLPVRKRENEKKKHIEISRSIIDGSTCPSMIKATKQILNDATEILVEYQSTHLGHNCEIYKLPSTKEKQCNLAGSGIQTTTSLDKTKEQYSPTKRLGLTTKPDVHNICRDLNVSDVAHTDDAMAVDILVHKMMNEGYNPVLIYQPQGENVEGEYVIDVSEIEISQDQGNIILKQVSKKPKLDLDNEKSAISEYLQNISMKVEAVDSVEDLRTYMKNHLQHIQTYLDSREASEK